MRRSVFFLSKRPGLPYKRPVQRHAVNAEKVCDVMASLALVDEFARISIRCGVSFRFRRNFTPRCAKSRPTGEPKRSTALRPRGLGSASEGLLLLVVVNGLGGLIFLIGWLRVR